MSDYFKNVPEIRFEGKTSKNAFAFKYYDAERVIAGKKMKDHLKFAMSWWHTLTAEGTDPFGAGTMDRSYGFAKHNMERAKARADAGFELMQKLGIEYFCFHDVDLVPEGDNLAERQENLLEMTDYLHKKMRESSRKLLWGTSNCFSSPRFMHGAATSCDAEVFAYTAAQLKYAMDATFALGGCGYTFWGGREGYETLLNTKVGLELANLAEMLRMAVKYAKSKGFKGSFYIEPKPKEPTKHQYDFDVATCVAFLHEHGLKEHFKMNIEANHATLAGHTFQHELRMASIMGVFGSVDANQGDLLLGWDTDQFPSDIYNTTLAMYEILNAGGFQDGGLNFDAKVRRASYRPEDIAIAYIVGMDALALGLIKAQQLIEDGRLEAFMHERYSSYDQGIGLRIRKGECSIEELEAYAAQKGDIQKRSGQQEYLEGLVNNILFNGEL